MASPSLTSQGDKALSVPRSPWQRHPLWRHLRRPGLGWWAPAIILLVAAAYGVTGWLVLQIPFTATFATLVWAPSGIALYAVLRWGWTGVLGVMLGAIALSPMLHQTASFGMVTMFGNVLPAIIAAGFLPGAHFDRLFGDTKRVTRYLGVAVIGSTVTSALIGATAVKYIGMPVPAGWLQVFAIWWAGDAMGVLIVTPALMAFGQLRRLRRSRQFVEFIAIASSFAVIWYLLFAEILGRSVSLPLSYAAIPLVIWVALRFEQAVTVLVALIIILVAVLATARGFGPFVLAEGVEQSYIFLHGYLAVIAVIALYLSASASAGRRAMADLQHEIAEQRRIRARLAATNELSGDAIITINQASQITAFNPAATSLFGYDLTDIIGQPYAWLLPDSERDERQGLLDAFMMSGAHPLQTLHFKELRYRRKDGSEFNTLAAVGRVNSHA
ncbi:MAG TPA: MASE1 domain-containing protein [Dongiaceae bacterium]